MATAGNIRKCADIIRESPARRIIVVSAMGKFNSYTEKITDQLIRSCEAASVGGATRHQIRSCEAASVGAGQINNDFDAVFSRFTDLANDLLPKDKYDKYKIDLFRTKNEVLNNPNARAFVVSRGEYLTAKLFALYLDFKFVDAADIIVINPDGTVNEPATKRNIKVHKLKLMPPFVIGGFYGRDINGNIALFSRGGSDYTGAVLAALLKCKIYENWTDVNGLFTADPENNPHAEHIPRIDFDTLDYMTHHDAKVIHENVASILKKYRTPLKIDNTFSPNKLWTEVHSTNCRRRKR